MQTDFTISRRTLLTTTGAIALAGAGLALVPERASAAIGNLTVAGASITTDDGTITDVKLDVHGDWEFDGLDVPAGHSVHGVHVYLSAGNPGNAYWIASDYQETGDVHAASGSFDFQDVSIFDPNNVNSMAPDDFFSTTDGAVQDTDVEVEVEIVVTLNGPANPQWGRPGWHGQRDTTFTVSVENQAATADVGGEGEATVEGENQYPGGEGDPSKLRLTYMGGSNGEFRVRNENPGNTAPMDFTWDVYGGGESGSGTVAGGDEVFFTVTTTGNVTVRLFVDGNQVGVKSGQGPSP